MDLEFSILQTLKYSNVFNFQLTNKEIYKYLIGEHTANLHEINSALQALSKNKKIFFYKNLYSLKAVTKDLYVTKKQNSKTFKEIKKRSKKDLKFLSNLFFIKFVGITGSSAAKDFRGDYDVDLFFICQNNFVWFSRIFVVLYLKYKKMYRNPYCANIYTSKDFCSWFDQNIYIANEIARIKPLINKEHTFEYFLQKNKWVIRYLPNFKFYIPSGNFEFKNSFISKIIFPIELFLYFLEYLYMKPKISTERVSLKRIMFLKKDYKEKILGDYTKNSK